MSASYRDLRVWQCSMNLVIRVYTATQCFPKHELYGARQPDAESGRVGAK
jgi:23S rRNA-intervening sequence protein